MDIFAWFRNKLFGKPEAEPAKVEAPVAETTEPSPAPKKPRKKATKKSV